MSVLTQYNRLQEKEKIYLKENPTHIFDIKKAKDRAYEETSREFGKNGRNDKSDAFRHCFWSALLARELGYKNAFRFTSAHESSLDNPFMEKKMDLHNNEIGLKIGSRGGSDASLVNACMASLHGGELLIISDK